MYSVVLMMAMTSGGDVADFGHRHGGCCGGYESYSSCCGGSYGYSSCSGGYSGCCGGGRHHHRHHHHGYSCCGGERLWLQRRLQRCIVAIAVAAWSPLAAPAAW